MPPDAPLLPKDESAWQIWQTALQTADPAEAERLAAQAEALFAQHPPLAAGLGTVLGARGYWALARQGPAAAVPLLEQAAAYWREQPAAPVALQVFMVWGQARAALGAAPEAGPANARALAYYRQLPDWSAVFGRLLSVATDLKNAGQAELALAMLNEALLLAGQQHDPDKECAGLIQRASVRQLLNDNAGALADYQRMAEIGNPEDQAYGLLQASALLIGLQRGSEAIAAAERAASYYQAAGNWLAAAWAQSRLADAQSSAGRYDAAETAYQAALSFQQQAANLAGQVEAWQQLGALAWTRGQGEEALARYRHALDLAEAVPDAVAAAGCCERLAVYSRILDLDDQAAAYLRRAAKYRAASSDPAGQVRASLSLAELAARAGRCAEALAVLAAQAPLAAASADPLLQAQYHVAYSDLALGCGDAPRALAEAEAAQTNYQTLGLPALAAANGLRLGQVYAELSQWPPAQSAFAQSLAVAEQHHLADQALTARVSLAWAQFRQGQLDEARASLRAALAAAPAPTDLASYAIHTGLGVLAQAAGDPAGALAEFELALAQLDQFRLGFAMPDWPIDFIGGKARLYERVVLLLRAAGQPAASFARVEQARSRALLAFLGQAALPPADNLPTAAAADEQRWLLASRAALSRLQASPFDGHALEDLRLARQQLGQLWAQLDQGEYTHLRQGEVITWVGLQACLRQA